MGNLETISTIGTSPRIEESNTPYLARYCTSNQIIASLTGGLIGLSLLFAYLARDKDGPRIYTKVNGGT